MAKKSSRNTHRSADRRPAVWPWLLMPLVALALFFALRNLRQAGGITQSRAVTTRNASSP